MSKNLPGAIFALIVLSGLVVLGSSPKMIGSIIESVQNTSIAKSLFPTSQPDSEKTVAESAQKAQNPNAFSKDTSVRTEQSPAAEIPERILWRVVFSLPEKLENEAAKARQAGQDDSLWTNYFSRQSGISPESAQALRETASAYFIEVEPLDQKARATIQEFREKNMTPPDFNNGENLQPVPEPPAELISLQTKKDEIALRHRDAFKNAVGEAEFAKLTVFLRGDFSKGFVKYERNPALGSESQTDFVDNGFAPAQRTKTGGNK